MGKIEWPCSLELGKKLGNIHPGRTTQTQTFLPWGDRANHCTAQTNVPLISQCSDINHLSCFFAIHFPSWLEIALCFSGNFKRHVALMDFLLLSSVESSVMSSAYDKSLKMPDVVSLTLTGCKGGKIVMLWNGPQQISMLSHLNFDPHI